MSKRIKYTNEPMKLAITKDTLPPPDELRFRSRKVRVTVEVDAPTVAAFRRKAGGKTNAYLRMMGELLDVYATQELVGRGR
jgi:hypothetical protein